MSGGSYDYAYYKVEGIASEIQRNADTPLRRAFAKHLERVAQALHDIEWVDSGDYGQGDEVEAIKAVIKPDLVLSTIKEELKASIAEAQAVLTNIEAA